MMKKMTNTEFVNRFLTENPTGTKKAVRRNPDVAEVKKPYTWRNTYAKA